MTDWSGALGRTMARGKAGGSAATDRLADLDSFGLNPGDLRARVFVPERCALRPALVVVLHGCTQTAAGYDAGAGWSRLADEHGFILLFPEQTRANNPNLCFNWFSPADTRRDAGEAGSIRQMIDALVAAHDVDRARIFVTGLSAGGAMTAALLAIYPDLFAGGAIIAGLPYGCATSVPQAMEQMRGAGAIDPARLGAAMRAGSAHAGPWPTISIWHGTADATVAPVNADAILAQWRPLHGVATAPSLVETVEGHAHRVWRDAAGRAVIEDYRIAGMGHGTPLSTRGEAACGTAGAHMLEAGISSTRRIAAFWGLAADAPPVAKTPADAAGPTSARALTAEPTATPARSSTSIAAPVAKTGPKLSRIPDPALPHSAASSRVGTIIEDALRAAGLMR